MPTPYDRPVAQEQDYQHAFRLFLDHTDEKTRAQEWLEGIVATLPFRRFVSRADRGRRR